MKCRFRSWPFENQKNPRIGFSLPDNASYRDKIRWLFLKLRPWLLGNFAAVAFTADGVSEAVLM